MDLDSSDSEGFASLFDGISLAGWHPAPRVYGTVYPGGPHLLDVFDQRGIKRPVESEKHAATWRVEDGCIVGEQDEPGSGYGGYLVSDETFADFELVLEARPDWPADTGIMIRRKRDSWEGFQVLLDHRESGSIGGLLRQWPGQLSAVPFAVVSRKDADGNIVGLAPDDPATSAEAVTHDKIDRLSYAGDVNDFLKVWKWNDWNEIRIRCVGALPIITTWVNGLKIAELHTDTLDSPDYDPAAVLECLGNQGHIAFEVHDNDAMFGDARRGVGAQCRWRGIRIKDLGESGGTADC